MESCSVEGGHLGLLGDGHLDEFWLLGQQFSDLGVLFPLDVVEQVFLRGI